MKEVLEKLSDFYMFLTKKNDELSQMIYERTGKKYNIGLTLLIIFVAIIMLWVVKVFLGWLISLI